MPLRQKIFPRFKERPLLPTYHVILYSTEGKCWRRSIKPLYSSYFQTLQHSQITSRCEWLITFPHKLSTSSGKTRARINALISSWVLLWLNTEFSSLTYKKIDISYRRESSSRSWERNGLIICVCLAWYRFKFVCLFVCLFALCSTYQYMSCYCHTPTAYHKDRHTCNLLDATDISGYNQKSHCYRDYCLWKEKNQNV